MSVTYSKVPSSRVSLELLKMVKIFILFGIIALAIQSSNAQPPQDEVMKIVEDCKVSEKATETDVMNVNRKVKPATREMKCLQTCFGEKMGLITNNQLNVEGGMKFAKTMPNSNEKILQSVTEVLDECKSVKDADRCEFGSKLMECLCEGAAKRSLKLM